MRNTLVALSIAALCTAASSQVTVPNTFAAGSPAKAAEVNANFQALATAINTLTARVGKLDGQATTVADLAGTYAVNGMQTELVPGSNFGRVLAYTYEGTITLAADGTGTNTASARGHNLFFSATLTTPAALATTRSAFATPFASPTFTWSLSNNSVTAFGGTFSIVSGGRLLIHSGSNPADGTNILLLLTRTN